MEDQVRGWNLRLVDSMFTPAAAYHGEAEFEHPIRDWHSQGAQVYCHTGQGS